MITEGSANPDSNVSCVHARAELERLLSDPRFHCTERARKILTYLADRRFLGHSESVKAYTIALDVLGRQSDFDPTTDPIVRIEMSRLRSALAQYYKSFGAETNVTLTLPKGNYVAAFAYTDGAMAEVSLADAQETSSTQVPIHTDEAVPAIATPLNDIQKPPPSRPGTGSGLLVGSVLFGIVLVFAAILLNMRTDHTEKPTVAVAMSANELALAGEASLTRDMLLTALTQFGTLNMTTAETRSHTLSSALRPVTANSYMVDLKYSGDGAGRGVWWQVLDSRTGDVLKSGVERARMDGRSALDVREELVSVLSRRFASTRGVINVIEANESHAGALGNACVLRAEQDLDDARIDQLDGAVECLERTTARDPNDSDAIAALSRVIMARTRGAADRNITQQALQLANRAASMTPLSDRAQIALMMVRFYGGRIGAAVKAGDRALALNPHNPEAVAKLGLIMFASGRWQEGVSLAMKASAAIDAPPRDASIVLALDAYRRGDWPSASLLSEQIIQGGLMVAMIRAAALGEMGSPQAQDALADLRSIAPDFEPRFDELMSARRYDPHLSASIAAGLVKAGARVARTVPVNPR